jgi:hypothetical protein
MSALGPKQTSLVAAPAFTRIRRTDFYCRIALLTLVDRAVFNLDGLHGDLTNRERRRPRPQRC